MHRFWQIWKNRSILIAALALAACSPKMADRGHTDLAGKDKQITVGTTTQQNVIDLLGTPSSVSQFGSENWYYIGYEEEAVAFLRPEILDQNVLQIAFDDSGVVSDVKRYTGKDSRDIEISERETPTSGSEYGFFEQLIGNIGKFNKQRDPLASAQPR